MSQPESSGTLRRKAAAPRKQTSEPAKRREQLLEAATALFTRRNYSSVSIKDIATATKANASLIYYYFGSKEGLFRAVVETLTERAVETFTAVRGQAESPADLIGLWITNQAMQLPLMRKLFMISIDYASSHTRSVQVDRAIRKLYDIEADMLRRALRQGIETGAFVRIDVDHMVTFIATFLDGALAQSAMMPHFDARAAILRFRDAVLLQLRGDTM